MIKYNELNGESGKLVIKLSYVKKPSKNLKNLQ